MAITFNESYYLQTNSDVAVAVSLRQYASGLDHFNKIGARELRNPNAVFDAKYYAAQNPDVLAAVSAGVFSSVYAHYVANGVTEGRAPNASLKGFDGADYLLKNPDVAAAGFTAANALQHYVRFGVDENRSFTSTTAGAVVGNIAGSTGDDTVTPAGGQASTIRVEGGQQAAAGDTLVITSGSASSFQVIDLSLNSGDQNQTRDNATVGAGGAKIGPVVQGFENVDGRQSTINLALTAIDRTSVTNTGGVAATQTGSVLQGGTGRDTLTGNAGADVISGNDGSDAITGAAGNDTLSGGVGTDTIGGGAGADVISDGTGDDVVTGDAGADVISVDAGTNSVDGGADNDTITLAADQATSTTTSVIAGGTGNDTITLNATAITAASRVVVSGGAGDDTVTAGLGVETVTAGAGNDTVKFTAANLGTTDVFNGNEGQDIIQLEIPTGSGTNTFVFQSLGTTAATSQFAGFEAIALIDSSGNTNAKQYKLILTDTFVANNFQTGSFLIDARGLPGGSNLVIDFSQLTATSAALFATGAFRVLASPSTDVRDQNNVGITNTYAMNTSNVLLTATQGFTIFTGDTSITAGTAGAYNTDRTVNTGTAGFTYTTNGGAAETVTGGTGSSLALTTGTDTLVPSVSNTNDTFTGSTATLSAGDVIVGNAGTDILNLNLQAGGVGTATSTVADIDTVNVSTIADVSLTATLFSAVGEVVFTGSGAASLAALSTDAATNTAFTLGSGYAKVITDAVGTAAKYGAAGSTTGSGITTTKTTGIALNVSAASTVSTVTTGVGGTLTLTGAGNLTLGTVTGVTQINGATYTGGLTYTETGIAVTSGTGNDTITLGAATAANVTTGAGNDTVSAVAGSGLLATDTIAFGTGTDTLALTGTTAVTGTDLNGVSGVEVITVTHTTTNVAITATDALVDTGATLTLSAATLTTGVLTFTGAAELGGSFALTGGAAADSLGGGQVNDTLTGGLGADTIFGAAGADTIVLTETTSAADVVRYTALTEIGGLGANTGFDTITGFVTGTDTVRFTTGGTLDTAVIDDVTADDTITWGVSAIDGTTSAVNATTQEAVLLTQSAGTTSLTDLNAIVTLLGTELTLTAATGADLLIAIQSGGSTGVYLYTENGGTANAISTGELQIVGVFNSTLLASGDFAIAA